MTLHGVEQLSDALSLAAIALVVVVPELRLLLHRVRPDPKRRKAEAGQEPDDQGDGRVG